MLKFQVPEAEVIFFVKFNFLTITRAGSMQASSAHTDDTDTVIVSALNLFVIWPSTSCHVLIKNIDFFWFNEKLKMI